MRIKTKILLLIIATLALVLLVATYYTHRIVERNHEEVLREESIKIARQIESNIDDEGRIANFEVLNENMKELLFLSSHIVRVDIFTFGPDGSLKLFYSKLKHAVPRSAITPEDAERASRGELFMNVETANDVSYVNVIAPLRFKGALFGLTEVKITGAEFEKVLATKRKLTLLVAAITVILLASVLIFSMDFLINRPLERLLEAMSEVKEGNLSVEVPTGPMDEIGKLTGHFNGMVGALRKSAEEKEALLKEINRHNDELQMRIRAATEELVKRNEELSLANQSIYNIQKKLGHSRRLAAVGQLAATVAHELGTPLHSISGHLQLLMEEPSLPKDNLRRLTIMQSQLERIIKSIQNILDTTRPQDANYDMVDINKLIDDILILVLPETVSKQITVKREFQKDLPPVFGRSSRFEEVFLNLIDNAIDASSKGGVISVATALSQAPRNCALELVRVPWVKIVVEDNGRGIPPDCLPRIFEPFFTTKTHGNGTGLGLAISQEIVQNHHGVITAQSRVGEGTSFAVFLPVAGRR